MDKNEIQMELVTVIIPIYNAEPYLERCINSIICQTWKKIEIILIDDGSTDSSLDLCKRYQEKDERIIVIHQSNAGAGMARNAGITAATGEYIIFFDSDDYVSPQIVEKAYCLAKEKKADAVCFGIHYVDAMGHVYHTIIPKLGKTLFCDREVSNELLPELIAANPYTGEKNFPFLSACTGLLSHKLIQKLRWSFVSEREVAFEDCYSLLRFYSVAKRVAICEEALYYYCDNKDSLSHTICNGRGEYLNFSHVRCIELSRSLGLPKEVELRLSQVYIDNVIAYLKQIEMARLPERQKSLWFRRVLADQYMRQTLEELPRKHIPAQKKILLWGMQCGWNRFVWGLVRCKRLLRK